MKIVSPVTSFSETRALIKAGADELYCGVLPADLLRKYGIVSCLNRRPNVFSNLSGYRELVKIVNLAHAGNVRVALTINEFYPETQIEPAWEQFKRGIECGVDAFIVSDIGLLCRIQGEKKNARFEVHISNCGAVFNPESVAFYREFGASRIILPRDLNTAEAAGLVGSMPAGMEAEAFVLNQKCRNIDGFCSFQHGINPPGIRFPPVSAFGKLIAGLIPVRFLKSARISAIENELGCCLDYDISPAEGSLGAETIRSYYENRACRFLDSCGACAIYDLNAAGIKFLKIVGRCLVSDKVKDIRFIKACLGLLDSAAGKNEFTRGVKGLKEKFFGTEKGCGREYCYY